MIRSLLLGVLALAPLALVAGPSESLRAVVIFSRHGVRSPTQPNERIQAYAAQPWPSWSVPPGQLTAHGHQLMVLMGRYYEDRYEHLGLLSGDAAKDQARVFVYAHNTSSRCMETAQALVEGGLGGGHETVGSFPGENSDPLFAAADAGLGHPSGKEVAAAIQGRVGGDLAKLDASLRPEFAELQAILGAAPAPLLSERSEARAVAGPKLVELRGAVSTGSEMIENLLLEYADGQSDVGWGRFRIDRLSSYYRIHALNFDLSGRTFVLAQIRGSNLASHILRTLEQAASGRPESGAFGTPDQRVFAIVGHDGNVANLAGLLDITWTAAGLADSPTLPGGALVFELWSGAAPDSFGIRAYYIAQSPDQMRQAAPLTVAHPPTIAPLYLPGCGPETGPDHEVSLAGFARHVRQVIDPEYLPR